MPTYFLLGRLEVLVKLRELLLLSVVTTPICQGKVRGIHRFHLLGRMKVAVNGMEKRIKISKHRRISGTLPDSLLKVYLSASGRAF